MEILLLLALPLLAFSFGGGHDDDPADAGPDEPEQDHVNEINGGPGDDSLSGTAAADHIVSGEGNDEVSGFAGNDVIDTGAGDDVAYGGAGNDVIQLGEGDDLTSDHEYFQNGEALTFVPEASAGDDLIRGGAGEDTLQDSNGSDTLYGDTGNDFLFALDHSGNNDAPDRVFGGFGADEIFADRGDVVSGNQGDDSFHVWVDQTGTEPVTITDYDGQHDQLELSVNSANFPNAVASDMSSHTDAVSGDVTISVQGQPVIVLNNPVAFDLAQISLVQDTVTPGF